MIPPRITANFVRMDGTPIPCTIRAYNEATGELVSEHRTGGHPQANPAVIAFLNELGWAMRDEQAIALVAYERREALRKQYAAADEPIRLTDEMGLYRTDQEAS